MTRLFKFILLYSIIITAGSCSFQNLGFRKGDRLNVEKISTETTIISTDIIIENPNNYAIRVKSCKADAFINNVRVGKLKIEKSIRLKAKSEQTEKVLLELEGGAMISLIPSLLFAKDIHLKLEGEIKGGVFLFSKKIPIQYEQTISKEQLLQR